MGMDKRRGEMLREVGRQWDDLLELGREMEHGEALEKENEILTDAGNFQLPQFLPSDPRERAARLAALEQQCRVRKNMNYMGQRFTIFYDVIQKRKKTTAKPGSGVRLWLEYSGDGTIEKACMISRDESGTEVRIAKEGEDARIFDQVFGMGKLGQIFGLKDELTVAPSERESLKL